MSLASNTKLGPYQIVSPLGSGGMGEVYRARDTRLGRDVAIKVLPASYSDNQERLRRFEQEACAASALNHPNIISIYDVGTQDDAPYVVSELLEGKTLRSRLSGNPLGQRRALDYASQIVNGLAAAHEKGIVHRDLKPENIFITNDGRVKILDFGLAKLTQLDGNQAQTDIPTRRVDTDPGVVMGTVGYMSPEQLKGSTVDQRSDIFSFGAILYEMLSGRRAFHGESAAETMSAILKEDPPELSETNKTVSPALERLVNHCLEKEPEARFHSARDLAFAFEALSGTSVTSGETATVFVSSEDRPKSRKRLAWILSGGLLLTLLAAQLLYIAYLRRVPSDDRIFKLAVLLPEKANMSGTTPTVALSPDGRRLAFIATHDGRNLVWVQSLDSFKAQALPETQGVSTPSAPFWSPDGRFIAFLAEGKLKRIEASGGPAQTVCDAVDFRGGTWNQEGIIVFGTVAGPLYRVSAAGGERTQVTTIDSSRFESSHRWPYFLPDGRNFLYLARSGRVEGGGVYIGSLDSKETRRLLPSIFNAAYAHPGFLLFLRNDTLMAQRFDAEKLELQGEPVAVAAGVAYNPGFGRASFSVSQNDVLAFRTGSGEIDQPQWFDRGGKQIGSLGEPGIYFNLWLSPDESRVAVDRSDVKTGTTDIWLFDLLRGGIPSRFTTDAGADANPLWSPDGSRILFNSNRDGVANLYQKIVSGGGNEELLFKSNEEKVPTDWSVDNRFILYQTFNPKTTWDLWVLSMSAEAQPQPSPFIATEFNERQAKFSPNGKWVAYTSNLSGASEIYVESFPYAGNRLRISTNGGAQPRWSRDGRELFYIAADRKLMVVNVKAGDTIEASVPKPLFDTRAISVTEFRNHYVVTNDGQRFLINSLIEEAGSAPISVVVNWTAGLK